jgi:hypothetical protein
MRTTFRVDSPKDIDFTATFTMPLKDWMLLREQLMSKWPSCDLAMAIIDITHQATKSFAPETPAETE